MCVPNVRVMSLRIDVFSACFCSSNVGCSIHSIIAGGQKSGMQNLGFENDADDPTDIASSESKSARSWTRTR